MPDHLLLCHGEHCLRGCEAFTYGAQYLGLARLKSSTFTVITYVVSSFALSRAGCGPYSSYATVADQTLSTSFATPGLRVTRLMAYVAVWTCATT